MDNGDNSKTSVEQSMLDVEPTKDDLKQSTSFIDKALHDIISWERMILDLKHENEVLTSKLQNTEGLMTGLNERFKQVESSKDSLQETVKLLQEELKENFRDKEEVYTLQQQLSKAINMVQTLENDLEIEQNHSATKIKTIEFENAKKFKKFQEETIKEGDRKAEIIQGKYDELQATLDQTKSENLTEKKAYENKLIKIQMELEEKLSVIQAQKSHVQTKTSNPMQNNNNIFRRKLQHVKEEHLREVAQLKQEIEVLKWRLSNLDHHSSGSIYNPPKPVGSKRPGILKRK